jgi:ubiquinone/menaquinone biosynthesis C-methylase UbiE
MSWYEQKIFNPYILDKSLDIPEVHAVRARVLAEAKGEVLEIGLGTGLNLPNYPAAVTRVASVGPEAEVHPFASRRAAERGVEVDHVRGDARQLPFDKGRFDTVVCTLVLCTIPEPEKAAREFARVLRPDGRLLFFEHVGAKGGARRTFQRLLRAPMQRVLCGCDMTRDTERTLATAGFGFREIERYDVPEMAWLFRGVIRGVASAG